MILQQRFTDCSGQPITNTKVTFTPVYSPEITSSFLAVSDPKTLTTNTNGEITGTLVDPYFYRVHIAKPLPETNFYDFVGTASVTVISASINSGIIPSIYGSLIDVIENPFTVKRVTITPARNYPVIYNSSIVVLASTSSLTDATGFIDFHLVPGAYRVDCFGSTDTSFFISVPTGSTPSWNIKDLIIVKPAKGISVKLTDADKSQVLTVSSSDARYLNFVSNTSISSSYSDFALQAGQAYIADQSQFADRATSASYAKSASWAPADIDVVITNVASA